MKNIHEGRLEFDDMELMQLEYYVNEMKKSCSMGGEIRRHDAIWHKIKKEQSRRILIAIEKELGKSE